MENFRLRRYQSSDKEYVKKLYELASINSEIGYRSGPWEHDFDDIENAYVKEGDFLVGILGDEIIAIGGYEKITDELAHIRRMRVHPNHRRKGYAKQLLETLETSARNKKFTTFRLRTSTQQEMAQRFYESQGFRKIPAETSFYTEGGGNTFEVIWYEKKLK